MSDNVDTVRRLYRSFADRDSDAARRLLSDDVQWLQCEGFPGGGHHYGADKVIAKVFGGLRSQWQEFAATVEDFLDAGDHVVALGKYSGKHSVTGKEMVSVFAHVFDITDGRVTRFRQYADTAPMVAAMQLDD